MSLFPNICCGIIPVVGNASCDTNVNYRQAVLMIDISKVNPGRMGYVKKLLKQNRIIAINYSYHGWDENLDYVCSDIKAKYHYQVHHKGAGQEGKYYL